MARHRNVRTMNYDEEYDGYDDVYGHSVEDDYASSPSMQHFLYDRNQSQHQMSAYMSNQIPSEIPEEDEIIDEETSSTRRDSGAPPRVPPLGELEQAQLYSCLDLLRDRMGDALSEQAAIDAILASNFDAEKALDQLLKRSVPETLISTPKTCAREVFRPPTQDITMNSSPQTRVNLGQLATMHLSKKTPSAEKPSLSQLALLNTTPMVSKTSSTQQALKPNLAVLAKMNLSAPIRVRATTTVGGSTRPSLSDLARVNLQQRMPTIPKPIPPLMNQTLSQHVHSVDPGLNLISALRSKCSISEDRKNRPMNTVQNDVLTLPLVYDSSPIDSSLICSKASSLGRVLTTTGGKTKTVFFKFNRKNLASRSFSNIKPFNFSTPSPDDLIKSRLRVA